MQGWRLSFLCLLVGFFIANVPFNGYAAESDAQGVLMGTVLSPQGAPVPGAVVTAFALDGVRPNGNRRPGMGLGPESRVDRDGTFRLALAFGRYLVRVAAPGFQTLFYEHAPDRTQADTLALSANVVEVVWPVVLTPDATLSGQVVDAATGKRVAGGFVVADRQGSRPVFRKRAPVLQGAYVLEGLPEGAYRIQALVDGYVTGETRATVHIGDALTDVTVRVSLGLSISGHVRAFDGTPLSDVRVLAEPVAGQGRSQETQTGADGAFQITGLSAESYIVSAFLPGYVTLFYNGATAREQAQPVVVAAGLEPTGIDFALKSVGAIYGSVKDRTGAPLAHARVVAVPPGGTQRRMASTDANGAFVLTNLPAGDYLVRGGADGYAPVFYDGALTQDQAKPVHVTAEGHTTGVNFALGHLSKLSGQVTDRAGHPVSDARVWLSPQSAGGQAVWDVFPFSGPSATTDKDGRYVIEKVLPGEFWLKVDASGFAEGIYASEGTPTTVAVGIEDVVPNLNVVLSKLGTITGKIQAADNGKLTGIEVVAEPVRMPASESAASANGADGAGTIRPLHGVYRGDLVDAGKGLYRISNLPAGNYIVQALARNYVAKWYPDAESAQGAQPIAVALDGVVDGIDFSLLQGGRVTGAVVSDQTGRPLADVRITVRSPEQPGVLQTTTDRNGTFNVGGLATGNYLVLAEARGYVSEFYDDAHDVASARPVDVAIGKAPAVVQIGLAERQPTDFDGNGVVNFADLTVLLQRLADGAHADNDLDLNHDGHLDYLDFVAFVQTMQRAGKLAPITGTVTWRQLAGDSEDLVASLEGNQLPLGRGYVLRITYDPDAATFEGAEPSDAGPFANRSLLVSESSGSLLLSVGGQSDDLRDGSGPLARLRFRPKGQAEGVTVTVETGLLMGSEDAFVPLRLPAPFQLELPPQAFRLMQNVPNPFNPSTTIAFELPHAADVDLAIYNLVGQRVRSLVHERRSAGRYQVEWDGQDDFGRDVSSGIYFYRFRADDFWTTRRMLLVR